MAAEIEQESTEVLSEHDRFYRDRLGKLSLLVCLLVGVLVLLIFVSISLNTLKNPGPLFFRSGENGELIQEVPLNQPNMSINMLLNWLTEGMIAVNTFNFVHYPMKMEAAREYFTPEGYDSFTQALKDTRLLEMVITNKYVLRAMPTAAPQVIKEGELANRYLWKIKLPMAFQYKSMNTNLVDRADLTLLVVRVPTTVSAYGVKILRYEMVLRQGAV